MDVPGRFPSRSPPVLPLQPAGPSNPAAATLAQHPILGDSNHRRPLKAPAHSAAAAAAAAPSAVQHRRQPPVASVREAVASAPPVALV